MEEVQPVPIRIKLIPQLEGSYLDEAGKKKLAEQLGPGAVAIIQKYVQVCAREAFGGGGDTCRCVRGSAGWCCKIRAGAWREGGKGGANRVRRCAGRPACGQGLRRKGMRRVKGAQQTETT